MCIRDRFLGAHSFHNFVSGERDNYDSEIFAFDIKEEGDYLLFTLEAKSFYRYMVRSKMCIRDSSKIFRLFPSRVRIL